LVHKVAEYYNLGHVTPEVGGHKRPVVISKEQATRMPPQPLRNAIPAPQPTGPPKEFKILKKAAKAQNPDDWMRQREGAEQSLEKSVEEKERAYAAARARIFEGENARDEAVSASSAPASSGIQLHRKGLEKQQDLEDARHDPAYRRGLPQRTLYQPTGPGYGQGMPMQQMQMGAPMGHMQGVADHGWQQQQYTPMAYNTQQSYNGYNTQQQGMMQQVTMLPQGQQFYSMDPQAMGAPKWNAYQGPVGPHSTEMGYALGAQRPSFPVTSMPPNSWAYQVPQTSGYNSTFAIPSAVTAAAGQAMPSGQAADQAAIGMRHAAAGGNGMPVQGNIGMMPGTSTVVPAQGGMKLGMPASAPGSHLGEMTSGEPMRFYPVLAHHPLPMHQHGTVGGDLRLQHPPTTDYDSPQMWAPHVGAPHGKNQRAHPTPIASTEPVPALPTFQISDQAAFPSLRGADPSALDADSRKPAGAWQAGVPAIASKDSMTTNVLVDMPDVIPGMKSLSLESNQP